MPTILLHREKLHPGLVMVTIIRQTVIKKQNPGILLADKTGHFDRKIGEN